LLVIKFGGRLAQLVALDWLVSEESRLGLGRQSQSVWAESGRFTVRNRLGLIPKPNYLREQNSPKNEPLYCLCEDKETILGRTLSAGVTD
jgi:hypothetical protein